jgi:hypothetical protein
MIVVDFNQTAIANFMAEIGGRNTNNIEVDLPLLRHMIINTIRSYKVRFGSEYGEMVLAMDNRRYWRRDVFPHYKAHRKKGRDDSPLDWPAIFGALNTIRDDLSEFFPYPCIDVEGAEADDVIGTLAEYSQTKGEPQGLFDEIEPQPFLIISGDHDFNQLQKYKNVKQYAPAFKKWVKIKESADQVLMEHIITGDKGDGVPNMLSPDDCFVTGTRQRPIKKKLLAEWKTKPPEEWVVNSEMAHGFNRNQLLVDLSKTPQEIKDSIINSYEAQQGGDRSQLLNYFIKNKMRGMMDVVTDF